MSEQATIRYPKLPSQGIVYGLDKFAAVAIFSAVILLALAVISNGIFGILKIIPVVGPIAYLGLRKKYGESQLAHVVREGAFLFRKSVGATKYRERPEARKLLPTNVLNIPGKTGRIHVYETKNGASVVFDALNQTATITCLVATPGLGIPQIGAPTTVTESTRNYVMSEWAKVLGGFTQKPHIKRIMVMENTRPGTVVAERQYYEASNRQGTPAQESYSEALNSAEQHTVLHRTQIAVTLSGVGEARNLIRGYGGGKKGLLEFAALEMSIIEESLYNSGFTRVAWLNPREWAAWGKSIIDPQFQKNIDARTNSEHAGVALYAATPMSVDEYRNHVVTDSGFHRTFWIHEWPRLETYPGFLSRLVFAKQQDGLPVQHSFLLVAKPTELSAAMKSIEDEKRTWITNANLRAKTGKPESQADIADWQAIQEREQLLVAGQGQLSFAAYVTVTATDKQLLEKESASIVSACTSTGLEPRVLYGQQAEALFNVAYPFGEGMK